MLVRLRLQSPINSSASLYYNRAGLSPYNNRSNISPRIIVSQPSVTTGRSRSANITDNNTSMRIMDGRHQHPPLALAPARRLGSVDELGLVNRTKKSIIINKRSYLEETDVFDHIHQSGDERSSIRQSANNVNGDGLEQECSAAAITSSSSSVCGVLTTTAKDEDELKYCKETLV